MQDEILCSANETKHHHADPNSIGIGATAPLGGLVESVQTNNLNCLSENEELFSKILDELGLTSSEQRIYNALSKRNASPAAIIAKRSKLNRSHAYEVLDRLVGKGLCCVTSRKGIRCYQSQPLEVILQYIQHKEAILSEMRRRLQMVLMS